MLMSRSRRLVATLITAILALGLVLVGTNMASANNCWIDPDSGAVQCDVVVVVPEHPGGNTGGSGTGPADFTPGPSQCVYSPKGKPPQVVDCAKGDSWWSNDRQCYWSVVQPQKAPPPGKNPGQGAWYTCAGIESPFGVDQWLDSPPPGIVMYTPAQAAAALARQFTLTPIAIGAAPEAKVHSDDPVGTAPYRRTWVGIPVWLWVDQPTESSWGPMSRTATIGGVTVTATAKVQSLTWSSGDGQRVTCGEGTRFDPVYWANRPAVDSPTCGFRYQKTSTGGTFTLSATTNWIVEWSGGGQTGNIQMPTTTSSTEIRVGELQSVNVTTSGDTFH